MKDIKKIFQPLEDCGLLIKEVTETIGNETKGWISCYVIRQYYVQVYREIC